MRPDPAFLEGMQTGHMVLHLDYYTDEEAQVLCNVLGKVADLQSLTLSVGCEPPSWGTSCCGCRMWPT